MPNLNNSDETVLKSVNRNTANTSPQCNLIYCYYTQSRKFIINKYEIVQEKDDKDADIELGTYLKDLFSSYYAEFILNFGTDEIMQLLED